MSNTVEKIAIALVQYKKSEKVAKSFRIPEELVVELKEYAENSVFTDTDIIVYAIKNFLEENKTE